MRLRRHKTSAKGGTSACGAALTRRPALPSTTLRGLALVSLALGSLISGCLCGAPAAQAAAVHRPRVGEAYIFNSPAPKPESGAPGVVLEKALADRSMSPGEFLDPGSRAWGGAAGIRLAQERASVLLARGIIAYAGNAQAAAAAKADGRIEVLGGGACPDLAMPQGHPAFALALADSGRVLAAWAQGAQELVSFDLHAPGCPMTVRKAPLQGETSLSLSASGAYVAAHDSAGAIWVGPRDGELKRVATLEGQPAAIAFSESEGLLLVLDRGGHGGIWSTRDGKPLRGLDIPGGPFVRGAFEQEELRLWTADGRQVLWDVLHQRPLADTEEARPAEALAAASAAPKGWLELRGGDLFFVAAARSWNPEPVYEPHAPALDWSAKAGCLRVRDVDGAVRYYSAATGAPGPQCLADDWTAVPVDASGRARVGTLELRLFDVLETPGGGSKVYCRMLSETLGHLWTDAPAEGVIRARIPAEGSGKASQGVAVQPQSGQNSGIALPLRLGLAASAPVRQILLK